MTDARIAAIVALVETIRSQPPAVDPTVVPAWQQVAWETARRLALSAFERTVVYAALESAR